jgi:hypothetical protein
MSAHGSHLGWRSWSPDTILKLFFSDVHTPFTLTLKKEHSHCEDADPDVIPNESSTEKVNKWEEEQSTIFRLYEYCDSPFLRLIFL